MNRAKLDHVLAYLADQVTALYTGERALRAGDTSAVHRSRVAARRYRSALRTFGRLWPSEARMPVDEALQAYAGRLGEVRDLQVLRDVLLDHTDGPLADWLAGEVDHELVASWQRLERDLLGLDHLDALASAGDLLLAPVGNGMRIGRAVTKAERKADKRLASAGDDVDRLHRARKAAKRARYAVEAVGGPASEAGHYEQLQGLLGFHHDCAVATSWLADRKPPAELHPAMAGLVSRLATAAEESRLRALGAVRPD